MKSPNKEKEKEKEKTITLADLLSSHNTYKPFNERDETWKDITPVPQYTDNVKVLRISYPKSYEEVMNYFRAIMLNGEISQRVYDLTSEVIDLNAMCYMAWVIRRKCLDELNLDLNKELNWLDDIIVPNQKNYQIWQHRKALIDKMNDPTHELKILNEVYKRDSKNFHAWCHRIWVMRRFNIYQNELDFIEKKLDDDIKNNSVWNYRFFIICYTKIEKEKDNKENIDKIIKNEISYAINKIKKCPINESAFSYLRGYITKFNKKYSDYPEIKKFLLEMKEKGMINHVLSMLVDIYEEEENKEAANEIIDDLINVDYIRKKYWGWRKENFGKEI